MMERLSGSTKASNLIRAPYAASRSNCLHVGASNRLPAPNIIFSPSPCFKSHTRSPFLRLLVSEDLPGLDDITFSPEDLHHPLNAGIRPVDIPPSQQKRGHFTSFCCWRSGGNGDE